ncbi:MAG: hypothetical protein ACTS4U_01375 [Candidatus Hodgkinia cicadicola]
MLRNSDKRSVYDWKFKLSGNVREDGRLEVNLRLNRLTNVEWRFGGKLESFDSFVNIDSKLRSIAGFNVNWRTNVKTWRIVRRIARRFIEETEVKRLNNLRQSGEAERDLRLHL